MNPTGGNQQSDVDLTRLTAFQPDAECHSVPRAAAAGVPVPLLWPTAGKKKEGQSPIRHLSLA